MIRFRRPSARNVQEKSQQQQQQKQRQSQRVDDEKALSDSSPRSVIPDYNEIHRSSAFEECYDSLSVPINEEVQFLGSVVTPRRDGSEYERGRPSRRAMSVQRPMQSTGSLRIVGSTASLGETRRARSTERPIMAAAPSQDSSDQNKRKSKTDKIRKLQAKNELYKEEYKKVQRDRKNLKKEVERRKLEVESLTKEIDSHIAETSILKLKLSEALQELERSDRGDEKDRATIQRLSDQLARSQLDLASAVARVTKINEEILALKESVQRKDEQIESLTKEVSNQADLIHSLREEMRRLKEKGDNGEKNGSIVDGLLEENARLQTELGQTLDRAAAMVKEREDAIAELLKENDDMKRLLEIHNDSSTDAAEQELNHLKDQLHNAVKALDENHDRTIILEDELEVLLSRVRELEPEMERLRQEVEQWQNKAKAAEESVLAVGASVKFAEKKAEDGRMALAEAQAKYSAEIAELEIKYKNALAVADERRASDFAEDRSVASSAASEAKDAVSLQDQLLQAAVANRQRKSVSSKPGTWGSVISSFVRKEEEEELDENQKRIRELEALKDEQDDELKKVKSELVRLRSSHHEMLYVNKKQIDQLKSENEAYAAKVHALLLELEDVKSLKNNELAMESEHKTDEK